MSLDTAPAWTTAQVCSLLPDAMLVRAQAASNCILELQKDAKVNLKFDIFSSALKILALLHG